MTAGGVIRKDSRQAHESGWYMRGKIIKSIAGFYEVNTEQGVYRCKAKGVFRALGVKPLVGDDVEIDVVDEESDPKEGNVTRILPRRSTLVRPNVANVDQALLVFAITHPAPSYNMLDRFLITMEQRELPAILCFNKQDLGSEEEKETLRAIYESCGCRVLFLSAREEGASEALREVLRGKTTVLTGPSGVGKSTLINSLCAGAQRETGELSRKIARGRNTTRHTALLQVERDTYVMDTPGFTSLFLEDTEADELKNYYPEFADYAAQCRFHGCAHYGEPDCGVKRAVEDGVLSRIRYENYRALYEELKDRKPVYR